MNVYTYFRELLGVSKVRPTLQVESEVIVLDNSPLKREIVLALIVSWVFRFAQYAFEGSYIPVSLSSHRKQQRPGREYLESISQWFSRQTVLHPPLVFSVFPTRKPKYRKRLYFWTGSTPSTLSHRNVRLWFLHQTASSCQTSNDSVTILH